MTKLLKMPEEKLEQYVIDLKGVWPDDYCERYYSFDENYHEVYYGDFESVCKSLGWKMIYKQNVTADTKLPKLLKKEKPIMSKYTYTQVEHLSDLDITGNTQYYLFEEGVGHEEFEKEKMKRCSLYGLESYIEERTIFTREEKPWFERIPEKGVLCRHGWDYGYLLITDYDQDNFVVYDQRGKDYEVNVLTPLTNHEIKAFLQEEE